MPTFYIHVHGGDFEAVDLVGRDLSCSEAARAEAVREARELLAEDITHGRVPLEEWIEVEDEDHRPVMTLPLSQVTPQVSRR
ncbi:MAG TPA: hypothetical protein VF662_03850 [Allosphingosinicella sp.]|jgi:hypothetical protein